MEKSKSILETALEEEIALIEEEKKVKLLAAYGHYEDK